MAHCIWCGRYYSDRIISHCTYCEYKPLITVVQIDHTDCNTCMNKYYSLMKTFDYGYCVFCDMIHLSKATKSFTTYSHCRRCDIQLITLSVENKQHIIKRNMKQLGINMQEINQILSERISKSKLYLKYTIKLLMNHPKDYRGMLVDNMYDICSVMTTTPYLSKKLLDYSKTIYDYSLMTKTNDETVIRTALYFIRKYSTQMKKLLMVGI